MKNRLTHAAAAAAILSLAAPYHLLDARGVDAAASFTVPAANVCGTSAGLHQVGVVRSGSSQVSVKSSHGKWKKAKAGQPLQAKEAVRTGGNGRAGVDLCNGSVLFLNHTGTMVLVSVSQVQAQRGQTAAFLPHGTRLQVIAPTAAAQGRGTYFEVNAQRGRSTVVVQKGSVRVRNQYGQVSVARNQASVTQAGHAPQRPVPVNARQQLSWTAPLTWQVLTAPNLLSEPRRVAVDKSGAIYITDDYNNRVLKLSPAGAVLAQWGSPGQGPGDPSGGFPEPQGVTIDPAGNIYVTDATSQVKKLSPSGQLLLSWGSCGYPDCTDPEDPRILNGPKSLTLDGAGNVYVADSAHDRLVKYAPDGHPLLTFGVPTPAGQVPTADPGVLNDPQGVAVDGAGNVYAADTLNNRIQKFSASGQPLAQWGSRGNALGQFYEPTDLTIDSHGNIYVADSGNNRIEELNSSGKAIATYDTNSIPQIDTMISPEGVALDALGNMYVVDRSRGRLLKYSRPT